ncbi:hypothetical protein VPH35_057563 [Triticum aestivum]|uniref:Uncharacterized protein n=1 Tax=Aegilops tauschii TaxID=37682 RepID=R7W0H9_AEGTA
MSDLAAASSSRHSGRRPWVFTDAKCHIGDRDNATTAHAVTSEGSDIKVTFELADPPGVSRCFVHCPSLAKSRQCGDPVVLSSADAFVLLVVPFTGGSRPGQGAPSLRRRSRGSQFGGPGEYNDFFVYRAGPGAPSLHLLAATYLCPDYITMAGVMPLGGADTNNKDYAVVFPSRSKSLRYANDSSNMLYNLNVYRSDTSKWQWHSLQVSKDHNHETCNEKGVIGQGWTVTTWNRGMYSDKWHKRFTVKAEYVPVTGSSYPKVSGGKKLSWDKVVHGGPTLSLCDDDVVYIMARLDIRPVVAWMLAINIKEGTLEAVKQCSVEKLLGLEPTYVQCAFFNYVKQWRRLLILQEKFAQMIQEAGHEKVEYEHLVVSLFAISETKMG